MAKSGGTGRRLGNALADSGVLGVVRVLQENGLLGMDASVDGSVRLGLARFHERGFLGLWKRREARYCVVVGLVLKRTVGGGGGGFDRYGILVDERGAARFGYFLRGNAAWRAAGNVNNEAVMPALSFDRPLDMEGGAGGFEFVDIELQGLVSGESIARFIRGQRGSASCVLEGTGSGPEAGA